MARGVDLSGLTRAERWTLATGGLLFANAFAPWWFRVETPGRTYFHNGGLTGWSLVAVAVAALAALVVLVRASRDPRVESRFEAPVTTACGGVAMAALLAEIARGEGAWIGLYVGLALASALAGSGVARALERRAGWR